MNILDFNSLIRLEVLAQFGDVNVHASAGKIVVVFPYFQQCLAAR
jgi:hypothetical protein